MTWLRFAPVLAVAVASPALGQVNYRDGQVRQALVNTYCASLIPRGLTCNSGAGANAVPAFNQAITDLANQPTVQGGTNRQYLEMIRAANLPANTPLGMRQMYVYRDPNQPSPMPPLLTTYRTIPAPAGAQHSCTVVSHYGTNRGMCTYWGPVPDNYAPSGFEGYQVSKNPDGSPAFGGGGSSGTGFADCMKLSYLISGGFLILPSVTLKVGSKIATAPDLNSGFYEIGCPFNAQGCVASGVGGNLGLAGRTQDAALLWAIHKTNMNIPDKRDWYGVVRHWSGNSGAALLITVPRQLPDGSWTTRQFADYVTGNVEVQNNGVPCPTMESAGHPYGSSVGGQTNTTGNDYVGCTEYFPSPTLGLAGYAVNPQVSVEMSAMADPGNRLDELLKWMHPTINYCPIDPDLLRLLADAAAAKAAGTPGYSGPPTAPIQPADVRPGDTQVRDLGDNPTDDTTRTPDTGVADPPPPTPGGGTTTNPPTGGGYQDECDFGEGGCTAPSSSDPTLEEHTGIFDPIFDWLPDIPSLTLNTNETECPVWSLNLQDQFGPSWVFLVDKHCELLDVDVGGHGTLRAGIGFLMIAFGTIWAGRRILSA